MLGLGRVAGSRSTPDIFENSKVFKGAPPPATVWHLVEWPSGSAGLVVFKGSRDFTVLEGARPWLLCAHRTVLQPQCVGRPTPAAPQAAGRCSRSPPTHTAPCPPHPACTAPCHRIPPPVATLRAELKFGIGDGKLRYYLFNWRVAQEVPPPKVGLVML